MRYVLEANVVVSAMRSRRPTVGSVAVVLAALDGLGDLATKVAAKGHSHKKNLSTKQ